MQGTYATQYQKTNNSVKNGQRVWTDIFSKEDIQIVYHIKSTWKDT